MDKLRETRHESISGTVSSPRVAAVLAPVTTPIAQVNQHERIYSQSRSKFVKPRCRSILRIVRLTTS